MHSQRLKKFELKIEIVSRKHKKTGNNKLENVLINTSKTTPLLLFQYTNDLYN